MNSEARERIFWREEKKREKEREGLEITIFIELSVFPRTEHRSLGFSPPDPTRRGSEFDRGIM